MTEAVATAERAAPKRDRVRRVADDIVTANSLATHLGMSRQNIARLTAEAIIEQRSDGHYDQTASRLRYLKHLRTPRSSRTEADAAHIKVKTEMLQLRMMERQRKLVLREDCNALIDQICGVLLTHMSGMAARCGGHDLQLRRRIEQVVYETRVAISEAATKLADQRNEPPWINRIGIVDRQRGAENARPC